MIRDTDFIRSRIGSLIKCTRLGRNDLPFGPPSQTFNAHGYSHSVDIPCRRYLGNPTGRTRALRSASSFFSTHFKDVDVEHVVGLSHMRHR
jgi:hypothetical protein